MHLCSSWYSIYHHRGFHRVSPISLKVPADEQIPYRHISNISIPHVKLNISQQCSHTQLYMFCHEKILGATKAYADTFLPLIPHLEFNIPIRVAFRRPPRCLDQLLRTPTRAQAATLSPMSYHYLDNRRAHPLPTTCRHSYCLLNVHFLSALQVYCDLLWYKTTSSLRSSFILRPHGLQKASE